MTESFDYIIVGGGTAGCVLAARLSSDPARTVLLLEAGNDYRPGQAPAEILDARYVPMRGHAPAFDSQHDWGLSVRGGETTISAPQARLVGGGSAINGMIALRGATADFHEWEGLSSPVWSWKEALDTFVKLETDSQPGSFHGHDGPVPINRFERDELGPIHDAFINSAVAVGAEYVRDLNAPDAHGVGVVPQTRIGDRRVSTADTHLNPVRDRPNLIVRGNATVASIDVTGSRASGVRLADGTKVVASSDVILAAGAILSPALLQRSGIGPSRLLEGHGIRVIADLPVGENLGDHFSVPLLAVPKHGAWEPTDFTLATAWRTSTSVQPGTLDTQFTAFAYLNARTTGEGSRGLAGQGTSALENLAGIGCNLNKPRSAGTVRIVSLDPFALPAVDPNYLVDEIDRRATREIVRLGWQTMTASPLAELLGEPIGVDPRVFENDEDLDAFAAGRTASGYHFTGTCRMATPTNGGVVDHAGRVYGVDGLRVADASVIPTSPAANSALTTIMVAERLSDLIVADA